MIFIRKNNEYSKMTIKQVFFEGGGNQLKISFKIKNIKFQKLSKLHNFKI